MIWKLLPFALAAILVAGILVSDSLAYGFSRIAKGRWLGEETAGKGPQGSKSYAVVNDPGEMRLLTPEEVHQVMKAFNPKFFKEKATGIIYLKEGPEMPLLPPMSTPKLYK